MVNIGDRVKARIHYGMEGGTQLPMETGTVVYIHPEGRFYTLEFSFPDRHGGTQRFRESYIMAPPPERLVTEREPAARITGWHAKQSGALGKYLETL